MATAPGIIRRFMEALVQAGSTGRQALDTAVRAASGFSSWQSVIDSMVSDASAYGDRFLRERCGIQLYNGDTGAITGADAGNSIVKTAESIVPESGAFLFPSGTATTVRGLTIHWPDLNTLSHKQQLIVGALNSWWMDSALSLVSDSYGLDFYGGASVKDINVNFVNQGSSTLAYVSYGTNPVTGECTSLSLNINMNLYGGISETDPNGSVSGLAFYLDRTIAHELTHAALVANMKNGSSLPHYFLEGMAELTHGIDDERGNSIQYLANNPSYLGRVLKDNLRAGTDSYAAGYMLLRYFAHQAASFLPTGTSVNGNMMTLDSSFNDEVWLDDGSAAKAVVAVDGRQTVGRILVVGNGQANIMAAGSGTSSLWGGCGGNDTLMGGSGADMFWYGAGEGDDIILGSDASDRVMLYNVQLSDIREAVSGSAVTIGFHRGGSLTVEGSVTDFTLGDGSTWVTDHAGNWRKRDY